MHERVGFGQRLAYNISRKWWLVWLLLFDLALSVVSANSWSRDVAMAILLGSLVLSGGLSYLLSRAIRPSSDVLVALAAEEAGRFTVTGSPFVVIPLFLGLLFIAAVFVVSVIASLLVIGGH